MQKTAYGLRISDWSSDVCSSDLSFVGYQSKTQEIILNKDTSIIILLDIGNTLDAVQINADSPREILNSPIMGANKLQMGETLKVPVLFGEKDVRSEEHTSELQSLMRMSYAVFCLNKKRTKLCRNYLNNK